MKKSMILLAIAGFSIFGCAPQSPSNLLKNDVQKKELISAILNDDQVSGELIDSLLIKHHGEVMTKMNALMSGDKGMQGAMMGHMMSMCKTDSSMCKMMMDETMAMCDADAGKCKMMMASMESHPNVMKSVEGMCEMKGMKMEPKKDDHSQHH